MFIFYSFFFFFFNDTATTEIYTLSLHDALPICDPRRLGLSARPDRAFSASALSGPASAHRGGAARRAASSTCRAAPSPARRSEEHTSELQSRLHLVCRLLLEKKKTTTSTPPPSS